MKKSKRIQALVDLNLMQEKKALEVIAEVQKRLLTSQTQVEQLKHYRLEYAEKFKRMGSTGTGIRQLLDFRAFMEKLDSAIHGQELALTRIENELHHKRKVWEGLHHRTTSLEKVCASALRDEQKVQDKQEQNAQDEHASRSSRKHKDT